MIPELSVQELRLTRPEEDLKAALCVAHFPSTGFQFQNRQPFLHPLEQAYYDTLKFERRKKSYLIGRYSAKHAVAALVGEKQHEKILIQSGVFDQPVAAHGGEQNIQVSIAHGDDLGAAVAFPEGHPMGIDLEKTDKNKTEILATQMTDKEKDFIQTLRRPRDEMLTLFWTVKEALSKILRTGLTAPFHIFAINNVEAHGDHSISYFENFAQYKAISFMIERYQCSIVYPKKTELNINIAALQEMFCHAAQKERGYQ